MSPASDRRASPATTCVAAFLTVAVLSGCGSSLPAPPETRADGTVDVLHGVEVADPYRWLEERQAPEVAEWIAGQNAYTDRVLGELPARGALRSRAEALLKVEAISPPTERGGRYFFSRRAADQDLFVLYVRQGLDGEDEVLLDPHPLSDDHSVSVNLLDVSEDGRLIAYGVREGGEDELTVRLFDVDASRDLPDTFPKGRYFGFSFTPDGRSVFYTRHLPERGPRLYQHLLGTATEEDEEIFGEGVGPEKILFGALSEDGRYLVANVLHGSAADRSEVYLRDLESGDGFIPVVTDLEGRFFAGVAGGTLYLRTNWQAPNGRVLAADPAAPAQEGWREVIPERDGAVVRSFSAAGGKLFVNYLEEVKSRVVSFLPDGTESGEIRFETLGTVSNVSGRWGSREAFFVFTSFHVPTAIYRLDLESGERTVWARLDVPIDPEPFEVHQDWVTSKDGTEVPLFLVHRKGLSLDGSNPTLLTGYGGFNASLTPSFSAAATLWVERGGVYAVANLRGGGEFGEAWHQAGMRERKQNVFDDFFAAAEWLVDRGYTRPEKLAIRGGSNGGLLVGAAMTQRPDLFEAVICTYPLLDMLRYHQFLVARYWVPEYGSAEDPELFPVLRAYSPYHNVEPEADYPAVLFITGDGDTRVAPLHARKMAARMQTASGSGEPVLLRHHTKAGHSGGVPLSEQIDNLTESYGFLFWQLGVG